MKCPCCGRDDEYKKLAYILAAYLMVMHQVYEIEITGTMMESIPFDDIQIDKHYKYHEDLHIIDINLLKDTENVSAR